MSALASRKVEVVNSQGMHARPIAMIVSAAARFRSRLVVRFEGNEVDGRSVLQLMTLCAPKGSVLELCSEGDDAEAQIDAVAQVIAAGFNED